MLSNLHFLIFRLFSSLHFLIETCMDRYDREKRAYTAFMFSQFKSDAASVQAVNPARHFIHAFRLQI